MIFLSAMGFMPLCTMIILSKRKSNYLKICLFIYFTQLGDHAHFIFILSYVQDSDISNSLCARPTLEQSSATKPHTALALQKCSLIFYTRNFVSRSQFTKLRMAIMNQGQKWDETSILNFSSISGHDFSFDHDFHAVMHYENYDEAKTKLFTSLFIHSHNWAITHILFSYYPTSWIPTFSTHQMRFSILKQPVITCNTIKSSITLDVP